MLTLPPGPGFGYDAVVYMSSAKELAAGRRLQVPFSLVLRGDPGETRAVLDSVTPLVHWPPGYPLMIAAVQSWGASTIQASRIVGAASIAIAALLIVWMVAEAAGTTAGVVTAVAVLFTPAFIQHEMEVLSEHLYLALLVGTMALMARVPRRPLFYGITAAASMLVRYVGAGSIGASVLWAAWQPGHWRARLRAAGLAAAPGVLLFASLRLFRDPGSGPAREFGVYDGTSLAFYRGLASLSRIVAPATLVPSRVIAAVLFAAAATGLLLASVHGLLRAAQTEGTDAGQLASSLTLLRASGLLIASMAGVLVCARLFADPSLNFDERIMLPIIVVLEIAVSIGVVWWMRSTSSWALWATVVPLAIWASAALLEDQNRIRELRLKPAGMASSWCRMTPALTVARVSITPVFSDTPPLLYWDAGRSARLLPTGSDETAMAALQLSLDRHGGTLVWCEPPTTALVQWLAAHGYISPNNAVTLTAGAVVQVTARKGQAPR